jgi:hypothetical protein
MRNNKLWQVCTDAVSIMAAVVRIAAAVKQTAIRMGASILLLAVGATAIWQITTGKEPRWLKPALVIFVTLCAIGSVAATALAGTTQPLVA